MWVDEKYSWECRFEWVGANITELGLGSAIEIRYFGSKATFERSFQRVSHSGKHLYWGRVLEK